MTRNTTFSALATIGVALFMSSAPAQTSSAFACDDPLASKDQLMACEELENFLRIKEDPFPIRTGEGEDPCLLLAMPYDLCLQTIGKEWLERQRALHKSTAKCSDLVAPGTVILTDPPTYNCKDLNTPTAEQIRIQALEKRLAELERHIANLRRARIKAAGKCNLVDNCNQD